MAQFEYWMTTDLKRGSSQVQVLHGQTFTQDNLGNRVGVVVLDGGEPATLNGTVTGYVIRADGGTVLVTGAVDGNKAYIDLPESAYAVPGQIQIAIRLVSGDAKTVLGAITAYVQRTATGTIIDPGHVIPDIDDLLARIDDMQRGTAAANQAASAANTAASNADAKAALADQKATLANTAAAGANQAADQAAGAAYNADKKAALADQKATLADQKATLANTAAEAADLAADAANDAAEAATDAAASANTAAQNANNATGYIAATEATSTASAYHAKGSYLIYDGKLYQATADIAIGDTLATTGTGANIAQVTGGAMGEVADLKSAVGRLRSFGSGFVNQTGFFDTTESGFYSNQGEHVVNNDYCCSSIFELDIVPTYYSAFHSVVTWKNGVCNGQTTYANIGNVPAFDRIAFNYYKTHQTAGTSIRYGAEYIDPDTVESNTESIAELTTLTSGLNEKIGVVENVSYSNNNPLTLTAGSYTNTGEISTILPNYYHSEFVRVIEGSTIAYTRLRAFGTWALIAAFDENNAFLSDKTLFSDENTFKTGTWTVPAGVAFVSFSIYAPETTRWDATVPTYYWVSELIKSVGSPWQSKSAVIIGDSITDGLYTTVDETSGKADPTYWETAKELLGISTFVGYGQTGTSISRTSSINPESAMSIRYTSMINGVDLVVVAGGTNDYGTNVFLGTIADTTDISFYGALNVLCDGLQTKYPGKRIVFITPLHRRVETANEAGATLEQYRQAIYDVARDKYGFAVIDGKTMGISCANSAFANLYIHDGLHPTQLGHDLYGLCFAHALNGI